MSEKINFPGTKRSTIVASDLNRTAINKGTEGSKFIGSVKVERGGRTREVGKMFIKEIVGNPISFKDRIYRLKAGFEKALRSEEIDYIPLPPTIRFNGTRVLVTEMTKDGAYEILDSHIPGGGVDLKNKDEIKEQVNKIAEVAYDSGVRLKMDNFSVVVDKQINEGRVYLLDLSVKDVEERDSRYLAKLSAESFLDMIFGQ